MRGEPCAESEFFLHGNTAMAARAVPANSEAPCETMNRGPRSLVITITTIKMTYIYYNIVTIETTKLIDVFETSNN